MGILFLGGYEDASCDDMLTREYGRYGTLIFWVLTHHLSCSLFGRCFPDLALKKQSLARGQTKEGFVLQAGAKVQSMLMQAVLAPIAIYISYGSATAVSVNETITLHAGTSAVGCEYWKQGALIGSIFGGWVLYQIVQLSMGWETGNAVTWAHHLLFFALSIAVPYYLVLPELTIFAVAMEISTPFLDIMLTSREMEGYNTVTTISTVLFALSFLVTRVGYFGYGLYRSLSFWQVASPEALAAVSDRINVVMTLQALFVGGYLLQLFWARQIVGKLMGIVMGKKISEEVDNVEYQDGGKKGKAE